MCPVVKAIEAHRGLTGLIAEKTVAARDSVESFHEKIRAGKRARPTTTPQENKAAFMTALGE